MQWILVLLLSLAFSPLAQSFSLLNLSQPSISKFVESSTPSAFYPSSPQFARTTALQACRPNAKKDKAQRNKDNMRRFQLKRGFSRRKVLKKEQASEERLRESEFAAKCFVTRAGLRNDEFITASLGGKDPFSFLDTPPAE
jgi:hypothetical protein